MSAYARSSVSFKGNSQTNTTSASSTMTGLHRFSQRERNNSKRRVDGTNADNNNHHNNEYPHESIIDIQEQRHDDNNDDDNFHPFSQITMSQSSVPTLNNNNDHHHHNYTANATANTKHSAAGGEHGYNNNYNRMARWRLGRSRELSNHQKSNAAASAHYRQQKSSSSSQLKTSLMTPSRRDKRTKSSIASRGLRAVMPPPPPSQQQRPINSNNNAILLSKASTSLLSRGASAIVAAMTPLRSFTPFRNRRGFLPNTVGISNTSSNRGNSTASAEGEQPSPLERREKKKEGGGGMVVLDTTALSSSHHHHHHHRRGENKEEEEEEEDGMTKTSGSTYDPFQHKSNLNMMECDATKEKQEESGVVVGATDMNTMESSTQDIKTSDEKQCSNIQQMQLVDLLSQIQDAQRKFDESKQNTLTHQQSLLEQHRSDMKQEWDRFHRTAVEEMESLRNQKEEMLRVKCDLEQLYTKMTTVATNNTNAASAAQCDEMENVKKNLLSELRQYVNECKTRLQVCGKLEVENLEKERREIQLDWNSRFENAKEVIEMERRSALDDIKLYCASLGVTKMIDGEEDDVVRTAVSEVDVRGKENAKPSRVNFTQRDDDSKSLCKEAEMGNAAAESKEKENSIINDDESLVNNTSLTPPAPSERISSTATNSNDTSDGNNTIDDESILNNSSLVAPPPSKTISTNKSNKSASPVYSTSTAPRCQPDMSVSTTPFSRKATPRIENSFTKQQRKRQSSTSSSKPSVGKLSRKLTDAKPCETNPSETVNGKKCNDVPEISSDGELKALKPTSTVAASTKKAVPSKVRGTLKTKTPARGASSSKKRSHSQVVTATKSPRRSKRVRESARIEQKQALEAALHKSRQVTPKEGKPPPMKSIAVTRKNEIKTPSPNVFDNDKSSPPSNETKNSSDVLLGKSVVINQNQNLDMGLDGCESIVQANVGPLTVPWGSRTVARSRKKSYERKRDKKPFFSSMFDFKF